MIINIIVMVLAMLAIGVEIIALTITRKLTKNIAGYNNAIAYIYSGFKIFAFFFVFLSFANII